MTTGIQLSGANWEGTFDHNKAEARGVISEHAWLLTCKSNYYLLEISEDIEISRKQLPLVGYGCGGWLVKETAPQAINEVSIQSFLQASFSDFKKNKLEYVASVNCSCSDQDNSF